MKTYHVDRFGDLDGIVVRSHERPRPGRRQVLIRVRANALNYRDLLVARGIPVGPPLRPGLMPLSDGAGEIAEVGEDVTRFKVGDRVAAIFRQNWLDGDYVLEGAASDLGGGADGMLSEYVVLGEDGVVHLPPHLSFEEGATLPSAGITAWNAVVGKGRTVAGDTVLVQGSGGVSVFALQFARMHGARVIDGGGSGTLLKSCAAARVDGRVILMGLLAQGQETGTVSELFNTMFVRSLNVVSVIAGSRADFEAMNRAIAHNQFHPMIGRRFAFDDAVDAYRHLQSRAHVGKVVIGHE